MGERNKLFPTKFQLINVEGMIKREKSSLSNITVKIGAMHHFSNWCMLKLVGETEE